MAHWEGKCICFQSDGMAVVSVLNQRAAISPSHAHASLHLIVKCFYDFEFEAINMVFNGVADALKADHVASVISQIPRYHISKQLQCLTGQTVARKPGHYQLTQHGIANSPRKVYAIGQKCFLKFSHWRPFFRHQKPSFVILLPSSQSQGFPMAQCTHTLQQCGTSI